MDIVRMKGLVASNRIISYIVEPVLNIYTMIRKKITGSYTKNKEDIIALKILEKCTGKPVKEIKYIDIGANHYKRGNNSYLFYEQGARGILVDANPILCKSLYTHRKEDKIINVAIGEKGGEVPFYILSLATRSSMDKEHVQKSVKDGLKVKDIIRVPCKDINSLLDEYSFEPDYLSIDIEGMDYRVLRTVDFEKHRIKVVTVERKINEEEEMDIYMEKQGYIKYKICGSNAIYRLKQ